MQEIWERGREAMRESIDLAKTGNILQALDVLDSALAQASAENRGSWVELLCRYASVLACALGDKHREIAYVEKALPYAQDYCFAMFNFAQLLLSDGQTSLAEQYAKEAYSLSVAAGTEDERDLAGAILKQWPNIARNR